MQRISYLALEGGLQGGTGREDVANTILGKMKKRVGGNEKEEEETTQTMKENRIFSKRWEYWKEARKEA